MNSADIRKKYPDVYNAQIVEVLRAARKLLNAKSRWTKVFLARNSKGVSVAPTSDSAKSFCALGAIYRSLPHNAPFLLEAGCFCALNRELPPITSAKNDHQGSIPRFNDKVASHEDILKLYDNAIKAAENERDQ